MTTVPFWDLEAAGEWEPTLVEVGRARHPGSWIGPAALFDEWVWSPINALLLRGSAQTVLVDAGSGPTGGWWPHEGYECDAIEALAEVGISPGDVDLVVLTHLDFDHAGGVLAGKWPEDLRFAFPGTPVAMLDLAADWATGADADAPLNVGTRLVEMLAQAHLLQVVTDGDEVTPGMRLRSAPGHRAGHAVVELADADPLIHGADILHHEVHASHPDWDRQADEFPSEALETRRAILEELADTSARLVISHIPGPGALRVVREGAAWKFARDA